MKTDYKEHVIEYDELANHWTVSKDGERVGRYCSSLKLAKESIDRRAKQQAAFERFPAWHLSGYWDKTYKQVTVTSVNEEGDAFITDVKGNRQKVGARHVHPSNPENDAIVAAANALTKEISALDDKRAKLIDTLSDCSKFIPAKL